MHNKMYCCKKEQLVDKFQAFQTHTENRILVLSWYTALVVKVDSSSFSTEELSPVVKNKPIEVLH